MITRAAACLFLVCILAASAGCAAVRVSEAGDLDRKPAGVRVFPPRVYLLVDREERRSIIAVLPDYRRAYDLEPVTVLASQKVKVEMEGGVLSSLAAEQDTSALLGLLRGAGAQAARGAVGLAAGSTVIQGTFGMESGVYTLNDEGQFVKLESPRNPGN